MSEEREQLLERVGKLYQRYGIKSITMDDVARELGISKKTLYQHFSDKNELVQEVVEKSIRYQEQCVKHVFDQKNNAIEELMALNRHINQMLQEINPAMEYDLQKYYPAVHEKLNRMRRSGMYEYMLSNLKRGKKEGLYRRELDEEVIAKLSVARMDHVMNDEMIPIREFTSIKFFTEIFVYHIRGIANEEGINFLEQNLKKLTAE